MNSLDRVSSSLRLLLLILFCVFANTLSIKSANANPREISVKGEVEFKLSVASNQATLKGESWKAVTVTRKDTAVELRDKGGELIASAAQTSNGAELLDKAGNLIYTVAFAGDTYRINDKDSKLLFRVKVKADKFNVYDGQDKRLFHGKQKDDGWGVKNEEGDQTLKVKGTLSLRETSFFAAPIPVEFGVAAWGLENLSD